MKQTITEKTLASYLGCIVKTTRRTESTQGQPMGYWCGKLTELCLVTLKCQVWTPDEGGIEFNIGEITPLLSRVGPKMNSADIVVACKIYFETDYTNDYSNDNGSVNFRPSKRPWHLKDLRAIINGEAYRSDGFPFAVQVHEYLRKEGYDVGGFIVRDGKETWVSSLIDAGVALEQTNNQNTEA